MAEILFSGRFDMHKFAREAYGDQEAVSREPEVADNFEHLEVDNKVADESGVTLLSQGSLGLTDGGDPVRQAKRKLKSSFEQGAFRDKL